MALHEPKKGSRQVLHDHRKRKWIRHSSRRPTNRRPHIRASTVHSEARTGLTVHGGKIGKLELPRGVPKRGTTPADMKTPPTQKKPKHNLRDRHSAGGYQTHKQNTQMIGFVERSGGQRSAKISGSALFSLLPQNSTVRARNRRARSRHPTQWPKR